MPLLGFGTWPLTGAEARGAVATALETGFRHIDTAQMYANEAEVGAACEASGLARESLFIATKVDRHNAATGRVAGSVSRSLDALRTDYVDLLLLHWPPPAAPDFDSAIGQLLEVAHSGAARAIGVANCNVPLLRRAQALARGAIATNQVEFHPLLDQTRIADCAASLGVQLTAYCPLARGAVLEDPVIVAVAERLGAMPAQVCLRWITQQGVAAVCMSRRRANMEANRRSLALTLSERDLAEIASARRRGLRIVDIAGWAPDWDA